MKFYEDSEYKMDHEGQKKKRYIVHHGEKRYVCLAYDAYDALDRIATRFNWGPLTGVMYDAENRGAIFCEAKAGWPGDTPKFLMAEIDE